MLLDESRTSGGLFVEVKKLLPEGAAAKAGIQVGDLVLKIDDRRVLTEQGAAEELQFEAFCELMRAREPELTGEEGLRELFNRMDADGSGDVDIAEFVDGMQELGLELTEEQYRELAQQRRLDLALYSWARERMERAAQCMNVSIVSS